MSEGYLNTLKKHKIREKAKGNGFGYAVVNAKGIAHPVANTILATGGSGKERNLVHQPKAGVAGTKLPSKKTALNSEGIRVMTPTEWGRLQGFIGYAFIDKNGADRFSFPEGTTQAQQYKQFGNSVTIPVIEELAKFMWDCFEKMNACHMGLVLDIARRQKYVTRRDVIEQLRVSSNRANYILRKLKDAGHLVSALKRGRGAKYRLK